MCVWLQRGHVMVKTVVQPMPLENYLKEQLLRPELEIEIDVPILDLPGLGGLPGGEDSGSEAGAAGMLQVCDTRLLLLFSTHVYDFINGKIILI